MLRNVLLVVLAVLLTGGAQLVAQGDPDTGAPKLLVKLKPGTPRQIVVGPRAAGVCHNKPGCPNNFTVMWVGQKKDGEKIRIKFTTLGASQCFDNINFTIDGVGANHKKTVTVLSDPLCTKVFFPFTISCEDSEGGNCGGVKDVDPGAMVDG